MSHVGDVAHQQRVTDVTVLILLFENMVLTLEFQLCLSIYAVLMQVASQD